MLQELGIAHVLNNASLSVGWHAQDVVDIESNIESLSAREGLVTLLLILLAGSVRQGEVQELKMFDQDLTEWQEFNEIVLENHL